MRALILVPLASLLWALVSCLIDARFHNFWTAFIGGWAVSLAALLLVLYVMEKHDAENRLRR